MDLEALKNERSRMKEVLRDLENEQRQLDAQQKSLRQREIRVKRTLEALETLISVSEDSEPEPQS